MRNDVPLLAVTQQEAADALHVSLRTIWRMRKEGTIRTTIVRKRPMIEWASVEALIRNGNKPRRRGRPPRKPHEVAQ